MQMSGGSWIGNRMFPPIPEEDANRIVKSAFDNGINWFDTAEAYGFGTSERNLSRGLQAAGVKDEDVVIATKWMPVMRWAGSIKKTIDKRIQNLHPYTINLHQIHMPLSFSSLDSQLNNMADLLEEGKIRSVGVSNFSASKMRKAHEILEKRGIPLASNQVNYNLLKRKIEKNGVLDAAKELGMSIICWGPLHSGLLTGKFHANPSILNSKGRMRKRSFSKKLKKSQSLNNELTRIAEAHNATVSQVALSWLVNYQGEFVVAIPGATKASQSKLNGQTMSLNLSTEELTSIADFSEEFI
jgi:aryl-alcohol dehydrogenase-like predicted oxidoreductase